MKSMLRVAVYGTLKQGHYNHSLLSSSKLITKGKTKPVYDMVSLGGYPSILTGEKQIDVEVYEVTPLVLERLDHLEGHPKYFKRDETPIITDNGEVVSAFIYKVVNENHIIGFPKVKTTNKGAVSWDNKVW